MTKDIEKTLKQQENDIKDLKKIVMLLKQQNNKLTAGYKRNSDKLRMIQADIAKLDSLLRRR